MKLTAIALLKWSGDKEPVLFGMGADLSSFGFFQRGSVKEMLTFVSRTVAKRTLIGQRQTVQNEEYYCHAYNRDGLVSTVAFKPVSLVLIPATGAAVAQDHWSKAPLYRGQCQKY